MLNADDVAVLMTLASCVLFTTTIGFAIAWIRARERWLRALAQHPAPRELDVSRFEQVSNAVDAIAVEVERLGEGQRFVTKLLAERVVAPATRPAERVITPH
jgi:hypothetical protein